MSDRSFPRLALASAAVAAAWLVASCGGGGGSAGSPNPGPAPGAPTATLTAPAPFASGLAGTITLAADATDDLGVTRVDFEVDGVAAGSATAAPFQLTLDTTAYASGQHVVRARATDASGNVSAWSAATVQFGGSRTQPAGFTRTDSWVGGLTSATAFVQAPDGRFFVAEQGGALRVVKNGQLLATPFVQLLVDSSGERGLIGVTLHPNFTANQRVYVYHTTTLNGTHNRISHFTANGDAAIAGTETQVTNLPPLSATNHNGGALKFGSDGKLYVGVGDNAQGNRAQDRSDPFGKILRFEADGSIPPDNPFCTTAATLACAVWATGLRNPFTLAVQPGTGRLHVNDVGEGTWEEIDVGAAGANYGWPGSEGPDNVGSGVTAPLFTYRHGAAVPTGPGGFFTGASIAGGTFYPAAGTFPAAYRGHYFFADYISKFVGRLDPATGAAYAFGSVAGNPVDMLVGVDGALYVLQRDRITRFSAP